MCIPPRYCPRTRFKTHPQRPRHATRLAAIDDVAATHHAAAAMELVDRAALEHIMRGLTTRDRALQRHIADTFLTEDVQLTHVLGDVHGREALYGVYRAAVSGLDYALKIQDFILDEAACKAACCVDLNIKLAPLYLRRYSFPVVVLLHWTRCEDGLWRIHHQIDHHSLFVFGWALGWPVSALFDMVARPATGRLLTLSGWTIDAAQDAAAGAIRLAARAAGLGSVRELPELVLTGLGYALPAGVLQQLGVKPTAAAGGGVDGSTGAQLRLR